MSEARKLTVLNDGRTLTVLPPTVPVVISHMTAALQGKHLPDTPPILVPDSCCPLTTVIFSRHHGTGKFSASFAGVTVQGRTRPAALAALVLRGAFGKLTFHDYTKP